MERRIRTYGNRDFALIGVFDSVRYGLTVGEYNVF